MPWLSLAIAAGCASAVWILAMLHFRYHAPRPTLGLRDGRLAPCPPKPNCVCTQDATPQHRIAALTFTGTPVEALARLKTVLAGFPRVRIISEGDAYLHAEFRSLLFRFVDDVEFLIDGMARVIHFRSASRAGGGDFGVNRRRMEAIRKAFEHSPGARATG